MTGHRFLITLMNNMKEFSKHWDKKVYNDKRLPINVTPKNGEGSDQAVIRAFKERGLVDKNIKMHPIRKMK